MVHTNYIKKRFNGLLPVVVDVETGGLDAEKNALLEIAAITVNFNDQHQLCYHDQYACHVEPFEGSRIDEQALKINGIDPHHPFRFAITEQKSIEELFDFADQSVKQLGCRRAVLVGHNAQFDLSFIQAAAKRCHINQSPFHHFTTFDTATLAGFMYHHTVLASAIKRAGIVFDANEAHSAIYDAKKTAELFCLMVNNQSKWRNYYKKNHSSAQTNPKND